jgi:hypothetical protein
MFTFSLFSAITDTCLLLLSVCLLVKQNCSVSVMYIMTVRTCSSDQQVLVNLYDVTVRHRCVHGLLLHGWRMGSSALLRCAGVRVLRGAVLCTGRRDTEVQ